MIKMISEYKLEFETAPFTREDTKVFFVASEFNLKMNMFIENHLDELTDLFAKEGLEFTFIPGTIGPDVYGEDVPPSLISNRISKPTKNGYAFSAYHLDVSFLQSDDAMMLQFAEVAEIYSRKRAIDYRTKSEDPEVVDLLYEMERIARALKVKGVKPELFDEMLDSLQKPGVLKVGACGEISLPDYGGLEIKLNPMERTLYLFMLRHPEGVLPDALVGYRKEILNIYRDHTVFDDNDTIENIVDSFLAENKSVLYANVSRIKKKFEKKLGDKIARNYVITRDQDGLYRITLPKEYIHWEPKQ